MSFGAEMKDFVEGYKTGEGIKEGRDRHQAAMDLHEKNRMFREDEVSGPGGPLGSGGSAPAIPEGGSYGSPGDPRYRDAISSIESGGKYNALGPLTGDPVDGKDRAYGRYQVMGKNVPSWTQQALGKSMTPQEFLADPKAQDAVFDHIFGGYVQKYGERGAAQAWFGGPGSIGKDNRKDVLGTTVKGYGDRFIDALAKMPAQQQQQQQVAQAGGQAKDQQAGQPTPAATATKASFVDPETAKKMDPKMLTVVERAARDNPGLFGFNPLTKTIRTPEEQADMVKKGWSKTQHSKHLEGKAVDLVPINPQTGQPDPNYKQGYGKVHDAMMKAAQDEGVTDLDWGGNWKSFKDLPHYQVSQLEQQQGDPNAPQQAQPVMWGAQGGVIPEPQYFADGGSPVVPDQPNPSANPAGLDKYSSARSYTQQITPKPASSFVARRVGEAMPGVTYAPPMQKVNGMTPTQLAYKQQSDAFTQQRAAQQAQQQAAAQARLDAESQARIAAMQPKPVAKPATNPNAYNWANWGSHREKGGMVYSNFAEGGAIPEGGPEPQAAPPPSSNFDPYDSEYWSPAQGQQATPGYAGGGIALAQPGMNVPPYPQPQFNTVIPDPNGDIITPYTDPNINSSQPYIPATSSMAPVLRREPLTQDELRRPATDDSAYAYDNEPMDRRSSRFEGRDPASAPMTYVTDPGLSKRPLATPDPSLVPNQSGTVNNPVPAVAATGNTYPSLPHRPYSPTPTRGPPGSMVGEDRMPSRGGPGGGTLTGQAASTRPTPPHSSTPDNTKTGSTHGVPTPTPRPSGNHGPTAHTPGHDAKAAPKHDKKYYNDPYEREKERFATRDRAGNLLPARKYAEGGVIPDRNDPYQNEQSNFAQPQPQAAPQQVDPQQTGSLPPDSGQALGQPSGRRPTPRLLSDVSKALHGGIQFLTQHFGLGQDGAVPTPEGQQGAADGARRFASGEGATSPQEIQQIDDKIDPQRKMSEGDRQMARMAKIVQFYLERGRKEDASAAAAGLAQYGAQRTQQYGSLAAAGYRKYLQSHDPADLQKVTQTLQAAYSMIPNGGDYGVQINPQTHMLEVSHTDDQGQSTTTPVSPDQLPDIIKGVQDKSAYWNQIQLLADPEGVHERDRAARSKDEDIRKHGVEQADTLASEGRAEGREIAGEGRKTEAQIATEKRAAETETAKDKRELEQKEAEHKQLLIEEKDKEKRANEEARARTILAASIDRAKELAKNDTKTDWGTVNGLQGSLYEATVNKDQGAIAEAASRIWDALPNDEKRPKAFNDVTGLTFGSDFKYTPPTAKALAATGDTPPANYEGKQPGDVVTKGKDKQGNPIWVVKRGSEAFAIPEG